VATTPHVLVAGSLAFDNIMDFPGEFKDHILPEKLHVINISFLIPELRRQRGGCAGNIAWTLGQLGIPATVLAAAGRDFPEYAGPLEALGVDLGPVAVHHDVASASCFITTDRTGSQITGFHVGAMSRARDLSLAAATNGSTVCAIVAPDDPEAMVRHCEEARGQGVELWFDPSFQVTAMDGATLRRAAAGSHGLFVNDYELAVFKEKTGLDNGSLFDLVDVVVVTLGKEGSLIRTRDGEEVAVPAAPIGTLVDPTGAGDAYRGGFLAGRMTGLDLATCARMGSVAAAACIEGYGTQNHTFDRQSFARRYRRAYELELSW
jgi:adenosine kinase